MREIRTHDLRVGVCGPAFQRERHISGSATKIQHSRLIPRQDVAKRSRRTPPPPPVNVHG
jgi:hypothetical protein